MSDGPGRKPSVDDDDILKEFVEADDPVLTASEIAEALPLGRRAMLKRLKSLEEDGTLRSKDVGSGARVWWLPGHTDTRQVESE